MKKTVFTCSLILSLSTASASDWVDDWFDNTAVSGPSHFKNQQRGFASLGSARLRYKTSSDYLFSIQKPRISAGCGGIDLFGGGISFMNPEYLVQKFEAMIQAAPAIAFDIALKVFSQQLSDSMKGINNIVDGLNGLQLDQCAMHNAVVREATSDDPQIMSGIWNTVDTTGAFKNGITDLWHGNQEEQQAKGGDAVTKLSNQVQGCPTRIKKLFENGSLIEKTLEQSGSKAHADLVRGLIGDIVIDNTGNIPKVTAQAPCPENDVDVDNFIVGNAFARNSSGACVKNTVKSPLTYVSESMTSIGDKMTAKNVALTANENTFVNTTSIPVYKLLTSGLKSDNLPELIQAATPIVAADYSHQIFDDLYWNVMTMFMKIQLDIKNTKNTNTDTCNLMVYSSAIDQFKKFASDTYIERARFQRSYDRVIASYKNRMDIVKGFDDQAASNNKSSLKSVVGNK